MIAELIRVPPDAKYNLRRYMLVGSIPNLKYHLQ